MTRLLLVIPSLDRCGAEKQLVMLATALPREEFDTHVAVLTRDGPLRQPLEAAGIPVTLIDKSWKLDPLAWSRLRRLVKQLRPDIMHTWLFAANAYGRQAAVSAGVEHVVASERCVDRWKRGYEFAIDRRLARRTQRLLANSTAVRDFYVQHGLPFEKFVVIPNGIPSWQGEPAVGRKALLAELGLPPDARLVAAVTRLWPQKRLKDLIWAADLLKAGEFNTHLLIIGDGPQRWRLERYRDQVHIQDRVHFLGARDDVPRILPHMDCLWLSSGYEGQSNAVMEAMAAGIPVVATDIPGNRDLVVSEQTGYLVPVGDRAAFAARTSWLLQDPDRAKRMGGAGRQRMQTEFSVEKMVGRHAAVYRDLIE